MSRVNLVWSTYKGDELVAYLARVSNSKASLEDDAEGLLNYLIKHKHWSPFEMVNMCVSIETTRDVSAQIIRHRSFSFQEFSQRYATVPELVTNREMRFKGSTNRQSSLTAEEAGKEKEREAAEHALDNFTKEAYNVYSELLELGVANECARAVLPVGLAPTKLYMNGTLRSWMHYLDLRTAEDTQKEHRDIALKIERVFEIQYPIIYKIWKGKTKNDGKKQRE